MAKRRAKGEGCVSKRADGRWQGRVIIGRKENGYPLYKFVLAKTQKELMPKMRAVLEQYDGVRLTPDSNLTLSEWLERWLREYAETCLRPSTIRNYRHICNNYLIPALGNKQLRKLTTPMIQTVYNTLQTKRGLSNETVRGVHMMLHEALEAAVRGQMLPSNPTNGTTIPKKEYAQKQILNNEQMDRFLDVIKTEPPWYDFFYTEITTGLRRGKICGLRWEDLDETSGQLYIRRNVQTTTDGYEVGETKTNRGKRTILLPASTLSLLVKRHRESPGHWIFHDPKDPAQPISTNAAYQKLKDLLKKAELPSLSWARSRWRSSTRNACKSSMPSSRKADAYGRRKASAPASRIVPCAPVTT